MLYVAGEIFLWMALAFVLGVLVGWFVWGVRRRSTGAKPAGQATGAGRAAATAATAVGRHRVGHGPPGGEAGHARMPRPAPAGDAPGRDADRGGAGHAARRRHDRRGRGRAAAGPRPSPPVGDDAEPTTSPALRRAGGRRRRRRPERPGRRAGGRGHVRPRRRGRGGWPASAWPRPRTAATAQDVADARAGGRCGSARPRPGCGSGDARAQGVRGGPEGRRRHRPPHRRGAQGVGHQHLGRAGGHVARPAAHHPGPRRRPVPGPRSRPPGPARPGWRPKAAGTSSSSCRPPSPAAVTADAAGIRPVRPRSVRMRHGLHPAAALRHVPAADPQGRHQPDARPPPRSPARRAARPARLPRGLDR